MYVVKCAKRVPYFPGLIVQPPTSTVVYPDTQAVFTCELTSGSLGVWFINGTESRALPEEVRDDISTGDDGLAETLTITARTQYNNTVVQCAAQEFGGSGIERSDNVTLTIQGTRTHKQTHSPTTYNLPCSNTHQKLIQYFHKMATCMYNYIIS